jgi:predicted nuclease of restriction endonuclease-like RecB superfamily
MLTKDLLDVTKRDPYIEPRFRDVEAYRSLAESVIAAYRPGRTRGEIQADVADTETHDTFKLVRGLSKLLDRRATFDVRAPLPPPDLRAAVFEEGYVTAADERRAALDAAAAELDLAPSEVEAGLWADRDEEAVLVTAPEVEPGPLLRQYNLSLAQTLLFDAVELSFSASDGYGDIFGHLTALGLMYTVDEELTVTVMGPAALFERSRTYGTRLAELLPTITTAAEWSIAAQVETEVGDETRIYTFELDASDADLLPDRSTVAAYDSEVERDFATRIASLAEDWTVRREPTILRTGDRVMIPDFAFERDGTAFYLEVVGFWTPEYLREKLEKVHAVESEHPLVLAVDESLNCTESDFADANVDEVFFYRDRIPVKPVLDRLRSIEERAIEADRAALAERDLDVPDDEVSAVGELAAAEGVEPAAVEASLTERVEGVVSDGTFVPAAVCDEIRAEIEALDGRTLSDVNPILDEYGLAQGALPELGYAVNYVSLDQSEAEIRRTE